MRYIGGHQPKGVYEVLPGNVPGLLESGDWTLDDPDSPAGKVLLGLEDLKHGRYKVLASSDSKKKKEAKVEAD